MGRGNNKKTMITEISNVLYGRFDKVIQSKGLNRSETIRMLMNEYVEKNEISLC